MTDRTMPALGVEILLPSHSTMVRFAGRPDLTRVFDVLDLHDAPGALALYVLQTIVHEWPGTYGVRFPGVVGHCVRVLAEAIPGLSFDNLETLVFMRDYR